MTTLKKHFDSFFQPLCNGDCLSRPEFHLAYEQMPQGFRAELIGGVVFVASPLKKIHGEFHSNLNVLFGTYAGRTVGVCSCDNATVFLSNEDEVQPDLLLQVKPEFGGQSRDTADGYIEGAPELIAEVAQSSRSIDLHLKRQRYASAGVREYLVLCLQPKELRCFDLKNSKLLTPGADGVLRSLVFPGLWIDSVALLELNFDQMMLALSRGLASAEHAQFEKN